MADKFSTLLNALLVMEDFSENNLSFSQQDALTIQDFHYCCNRGKNEEGIVGGVTGSSMMSMSVRLRDLSENKRFYDALISRETAPFTIVFNANFGPDGKINEYENAMTAIGFVVDVKEHFSTLTSMGSASAPLSIQIDVQLARIVYLGKDAKRTLDIIQTV